MAQQLSNETRELLERAQRAIVTQSGFAKNAMLCWIKSEGSMPKVYLN
jgi:hypothetical protein